MGVEANSPAAGGTAGAGAGPAGINGAVGGECGAGCANGEPSAPIIGCNGTDGGRGSTGSALLNSGWAGAAGAGGGEYAFPATEGID